MRTLLFTSTHETSFIVEDLAFLRRHYQVHHLLTRSVWAPFQILRRIAGVDLTFTWFASAYAAAVVFLANVFGKRSLVVIGGVDAARVDDAGYGQWRSPWRSLLTGYALRRAWRVLAVDESLRNEAMRRADYDGANILVVPTGFDPDRWTPAGTRTRSVLTVAACESVGRLRVKGISDLAQAARLLPDVPFTIVGVRRELVEHAGIELPENIRVIPPVDGERLLALYREAKVYCQASLFEGLPNSLCESMLCGCIPVATAVGGSARVVGDTGFLVDPRDPEGLAAALRRALDGPGESGSAARTRIMRMFPRGQREKTLTELIGSGPA